MMRWLIVVVVAVAACGTDRRAEVAPTTTASPAQVAPARAGLETAVLAGGCFWGMEELLRAIPGVVETEVGYVRGAESVRVVFDPAKLSYLSLLEDWYFRMHDPTTRDRQGNDVGPGYRSAIFARSDDQRRVAAEVIARVDGSGKWKSKLVTTIEPGDEFTPAEAGHQDYLQRNPDGYTCHFLRD